MTREAAERAPEGVGEGIAPAARENAATRLPLAVPLLVLPSVGVLLVFVAPGAWGIAGVLAFFLAVALLVWRAAAADSPTGIALRRLSRKRLAVLSVLFISLFYFCGIAAGELPITDYRAQDLERALQGPSWDRPFGTDRLGRDQFSRVIWSARTTVVVTGATLLTGGLILSVGLGLLSGYAGGKIDSLIMRVGDIFISLPGLLMLILINATLKDKVRDLASEIEDLTGIGGIVRSGAPDYFLVFGALSLFGWVGGARVIRAQVLALRETEFVQAARSMGASTGRILWRHLFPNVSYIIIVSLSAGLAGIAGSEIALTWFGVGIQPPQPSFGTMIFEASGVRTVNAHPYLLAFPAATVAGLIFSFNLLGDALNDVFTPKAR
jgi:ABC-type dipeptide/oligopeptide/nickel transport system permease subunit